MYLIFLLLFLNKANVNSIDPNEIVIVILDQKEGYHIAHAKMLEKNIFEQADALDKDPPNIVLSHKLNINGSWTIVPLLNYLSDTYTTSKWFFFLSREYCN